MAESQF